MAAKSKADGGLAKKALPWNKDPVILSRLSTVMTMHLQGARVWQIAEALGVSTRTIDRDLIRARQMIAAETVNEITTMRTRSINQLREAQTRAWEQYRLSDSRQTKLSALRLVTDIETRIVELEGTKAPLEMDVTSKGEQLAGAVITLSPDELNASMMLYQQIVEGRSGAYEPPSTPPAGS